MIVARFGPRGNGAVHLRFIKLSRPRVKVVVVDFKNDGETGVLGVEGLFAGIRANT